MPWYVANRYERVDFNITFSPGAFYSSIIFAADTLNVGGERFYSIGDPLIPLHSSFYMTVNKMIPEELRDKVIFVRENGDKDIVYPYIDVNECSIGVRLNSFGVYAISYDTIPPLVISHFYDGADLSGRDRISFTIDDELSGISGYEVEIDGIWALASYDPKNKSLVVELKDDIIRKGISHEMVIFVSDRKNNTTTLKKEFIW
jgi:hypothetical protein